MFMAVQFLCFFRSDCNTRLIFTHQRNFSIKVTLDYFLGPHTKGPNLGATRVGGKTRAVREWGAGPGQHHILAVNTLTYLWSLWFHIKQSKLGVFLYN